MPTRQALIAEIVERDDLMNAIALELERVQRGPGGGAGDRGRADRDRGARGLLLRQRGQLSGGASASLLADATAAAPAAPAGSSRRSTRCRKAFRYIFGNRWPRAIVTLIATFAVFGFSFMTMMPVFARDVLHLDAGGYGALVSAVGVGAAVAALFMAALGGRVRRARLVLGSARAVRRGARPAAALAPGLLARRWCCSPSPAA